MPPHILAVLNQLYEELKSMKQQQWTITNYGVLILAAIYAVKLPDVGHAQSLLKGFAVATAVFGSALLLWVQYNLARARCLACTRFG
jgi:membrane protein YdbS with pleckstrin-like domain